MPIFFAFSVMAKKTLFIFAEMLLEGLNPKEHGRDHLFLLITKLCLVGNSI